jgi:dihydrofolate reductase
MRKLIVQQWVTVDNIAAEEDGGLSFVTAQPGGEMPDNDFKASVMAFIDTVDTMIIGANTYAMSKDYWPHATDQGEYGEKFNNLTKFVASTNLKEAPWGDFSPATVTPDPVATVQKLKQQDGKDIMLWGSLTLMKAMFEANAVDEVQMRVCPTSRGKGARLFTDQRDLQLLEATPFENGVVWLRYEVQKKS